MAAALPSWALDAAPLPVAFAQVREDPLLDAWVVERLPADARIIMIASGGCTLAYLAGMPNLGRIDVVDPNPAQIALGRLKLKLLQEEPPEERLKLLGHSFMHLKERELKLHLAFLSLGLPDDAIGPVTAWAWDGPDQSGRYERVFAQLREEMAAQVDAVEALLKLRDPEEQARRVGPDTKLGSALDRAFDRAMALPILVHLFGEGATRNRVEPFARHFARRTRHVLATLPAADNPYLWQVLRGTYPSEAPAPWFTRPAPPRWPNITWSRCFMIDALKEAEGEYDFVHLSNILDWLSPEEARATLDCAHAALRPGGWILVRQLNSMLDVAAAGPHFAWQTHDAAALHARDRSFFYRALHLGRKA